ncbi:MAG: response regulator [Colwellia sp.]|nr:response regulator [Colwellia sp.]
MEKVLIVEDNQHKLNKINEFIRSVNNELQIKVARSFTSAWDEIKTGEFTLICLDMSLPTFEQSESESGGKFRVFGGKELARKMRRKNIKSKFTFITHYKNFSDNNKNYSFDELKSELMNDYKEQCLGVVFYSNKSSDWRVELQNILMEIDE